MRVLIADDHPLVRDALAAAVRANWPDCEITEAESLASAVASLQASDAYGLTTLDLTLTDSRGFSGLVLLQKLAPQMKIAVVSARNDPEAISTAYTLGAAAYLTKATPMTAIAAALLRVMKSDERIFPPRRPPASGEPDLVRPRLDSLSAAQLRILLALTDGRQNRQIASDMGLTEATVKAHLTAIFKKLGVANRSQAILMAQPLLMLQTG